MARMYYEKDCNLSMLEGETLAIVGYGSQGHAHAQNLRDSGMHVIIGLYEGSKSAEMAERDGFEVYRTDDAVKNADTVMLLVNDEIMAELYEEKVAPHLSEGMTLCFAHGFNIHYKQIVVPSDIDVVMIAPKGPGHTVRSHYKEGEGVPCLIAIHQDHSGTAKEKALAWAAGIGGARAGILETSFKEETETDLFGEQCVLCGGVTALMKAGFDTLVAAGYQPESAYFECLHEMKLIIDLVNEGGLTFMRHSISDTAEYGDYSVGDRMITSQTKNEMQKVLKEIQNGDFARKWIAENKSGRKAFLARRKVESELLVEEVGADLREKMSWKGQRTP